MHTQGRKEDWSKLQSYMVNALGCDTKCPGNKRKNRQTGLHENFKPMFFNQDIIHSVLR